MSAFEKLYGIRTLLIAALALVLLFVGALMIAKDNYGSFATAVGAIVGAIAVRSGVQALSEGGGVKGAWAALTTSAKPGEGPSP